MFSVHMATSDAAGLVSTPAIIQLKSPSFSTTHTFPPPNAADSLRLTAPGVSFALVCYFSLGEEGLEFEFAGLTDGDALNLFWHAPDAFTATIFHAAPSAVQCIARCSDGSQAPGCIVCKSSSGKIRGKICC
jgi:hypothetical protein